MMPRWHTDDADDARMMIDDILIDTSSHHAHQQHTAAAWQE